MKLKLLTCSLIAGLSVVPMAYSQKQKKSKKGRQVTEVKSGRIKDVRIENEGLTVLYGGAMVEQLQEEGSFETYLQLANAGKKIQFRSCAYTGDEIDFRIRASRFGLHLDYLLKQWQADRVMMAFGANEAYAGAEGLEGFEHNLDSYIELMKKRHGAVEFILISPTAAEDMSEVNGISREVRNANLKLYSEAMKKSADKHQVKFIDLFTPTAELFSAVDGGYTVNEHNLSEKGSAAVGRILAEAVKGTKVTEISADTPVFAATQKLVQRKALEVSQAYHPANGISYYGLRKRVYEYNSEIPHYLKLANILDEAIWQQATDQGAVQEFPELPVLRQEVPKIAPRRGLGVIKSAEEDLKDFTVDKNFKINCFASSEDHPELINPLQMQFDAEGRLWVSCFASYPHPLPGQVSNDTILIFEDTNGDGAADKKTVFADGLNLPDGFVHYKNGVIVATARELLYLEDTDGDSKADVKHEVLRGFDNTDTHHSGYLQRTPSGEVLLSEALFHRGQFETPHGVVRTKDSSIMSLDMDTRKLVVERQVEAPNPWKITYNKWGDSIHFFGGGQILDADIHNIASPMGSSALTDLGMPFRYDKGCTAAFVDSPHFPKKWQGGLLTGHLLTTNEVNYTPMKLVNGTYKSAGKKTTLVSSSNKVFRPTDMVFGSDGALYISDFYYPIIGHAQHSIRDENRDYANGRIWRVTHKKSALKEVPKLVEMGVEALVAELKNEALAVRQSVRLELEKRSKKEVDAALAKAVKAHSADDVYALELLWLMERQKNYSDSSLLKRLVKSSKVSVRRSAVRSLRWWDEVLGADLKPMVDKLAKDSDDRVKVGLLTVLSHLQLKDDAWSLVVTNMKTKPKTPLAYMQEMAGWKDRPSIAAEFPVLNIDKNAYIAEQEWEHNAEKLTGYLYFKSEVDGEFIIGHADNPFLSITVNDTPLLIASGGPHSKESQNGITVKKGINRIDYSVLNSTKYKSRVNTKFQMYLSDKAGNKSDALSLATDQDQKVAWAKQYLDAQNANWRVFAETTFKNNCANCHNVDIKAVGPALKGLFGKKQTVIAKDGSKREVVVDEAYIRRALVDPQAEYPEGFHPVMVVQPLAEKEIDVLVRWIKELK